MSGEAARSGGACCEEGLDQPLTWPAHVRLLDRFSGQAGSTDVAHSFALDELLCRRVGAGEEPLVHLWRHPRAFVMGLRDRRLPHAAEAMAWLRGLGYDVLVRNSGGAAVPLDPGVVNVSLILSNPEKSLAFRRDFRYMVELIKGALASSGQAVEAGEIDGAYCPGDYDLSIGGRKFCGIAQRRQTKAFVVQGFVVAEGSGSQRAALVREFYERAAGTGGGSGRGGGTGVSGGASEAAETAEAVEAVEADAVKDPGYPAVRPDTMASLAELGVEGGAEGFRQGVLRWLEQQGAVRMLADAGVPGEQAEAMIQTLRSRYDR